MQTEDHTLQEKHNELNYELDWLCTVHLSVQLSCRHASLTRSDVPCTHAVLQSAWQVINYFQYLRHLNMFNMFVSGNII